MNKTTYRVATLASYVLVDAADEDSARIAGQTALQELYADLGRDVPIEIRTVRLATDDEIELGRWHSANVAEEANQLARQG